jgi:hypothetical protein
MAFSLRFLSAYNGFVPRPTGVVVGFFKDPAKFPVNSYIQYVPTETKVFLWTQLGRDIPSRIVSDAEFAWEDGSDAPTGIYNQVPFAVQEGRTFRRAYPWRLGYEAIEQAATTTGLWEPEPTHMMSCLSQARTNLTNKVYTLVSNSAAWGSNTATANTLNGGAGNWVTASDDPSSPNYLAIYGSLMGAFRNISLETNSVVEADQLQLVVGPDLAIPMGKSAELNNYVRQTMAAYDITKLGWDTPQMKKYGLPPEYRGFKIVVDDTTIVTQRPNATGQTVGTPITDQGGPQAPEAPYAQLGSPQLQRSFIWQPTSAVLMCRQGALDSTIGGMSYSTVQVYHKGGLLQVEAFNEPKQRRVEGRVSEDYGVVMTSNVSGYLITATS